MARAGCLDGSIATCFNTQGCRGERECVLGHWTGCQVDPGTCPIPGGDFVSVGNSPGNTQVGLCVDALDTGGEVDDRRFTKNGTSPTTVFNVGELGPSSLANEAIAFAAGRAPTQALMPWTGAPDQMNLGIEATVRVPITVWIVTAANTFPAQALQAFSTAIQMGALFDSERAGLDWNLIEVRDATVNPNAPNFLNVTGGNFGNLETQIGHVNGRINVYWVPMVNGGSGNGLGEVAHGDTVAVGQNSAPGLLGHEIGHCLALDHVDGDSRFDGTNVMMSNGGTRQFLTEGQAFRAHIRSISAIRSSFVYGLRPGMPIRDQCDITTTTRLCPKADKRLWADGSTWPAN